MMKIKKILFELNISHHVALWTQISAGVGNLFDFLDDN